ncbi:MAG: FAD-dependent oxidoreductase [Streptosporangiaceae bacterium]
MTRSRVVIVGAGMAGARLAEEIADRDPDGRIHLTLIGGEPHSPYNRVLLTGVLAGEVGYRDIVMGDPQWYAERGYGLLLGTAVTRIDRTARRVYTDDGRSADYDTLVLALGADPVLPEIEGLRTPDGRLRRGVFALRTLDDCHALDAAIGGGGRAAVVGGGILGLETARGLAQRGMRATVVHRSSRIMDRQLDAGAAEILARTYLDLGVTVLTDARVSSLTGWSRVDGLNLADGRWVPANMVVVSCGVRPRDAIGATFGLEVDHGIVVGDDLATTDPRIFAIGDCARHRGFSSGLLDPAWEQARVLAARLTGAEPQARYTGSALVTKLKAHDVELTTLGQTDAHDRAEVVLFSDPTRRTYLKLVIDGGRITGAILLGDGKITGSVTQFFDGGAQVPSDPKSLLFGTAPAAAAVEESDEAIICRCNLVTRAEINEAIVGGARDVQAVTAATRSGTGCGSCRGDVTRLLDDLPEPVALSAE